MSWDDPFKNDPLRRMQEMMDAADPLRRLRDSDPHCRMEEIFSRHDLGRQISEYSAITRYSVDITDQFKDLTAAARSSDLELFRAAAAAIALQDRFATAGITPIPRPVVGLLEDILSKNSALSTVAEGHKLLERLSGIHDVSYAARVELGAFYTTREDEDEDEDAEEAAEREPDSADREEAIEESDSDFSELDLPDEIHQSLLRVDYLPLHVHQMIARDQGKLFDLNPRQFEEYIADLLSGLGFEDILLTPQSGDHGRDLVAIKRVEQIPLIFAFECKRYAPDRPIGPHILRALLGTVKSRDTAANVGVLVTTSYFTRASREMMISEPCIDGKDFDGLALWIEQFARKRGIP